MSRPYLRSRPAQREPVGSGDEPGEKLRIEVILLSSVGERFLVRADGARLRCLRLRLPTSELDPGALKGLVEQLLITQAGVEASFLGLLSFDTTSDGAGVAVAAAVLTAQVALPGDPSLRLLTLADIAGRGSDVDHGPLYGFARRWRTAEEIAPGLSAAIQRACDTSIAYLDSHLSVEDSCWGWNQYQDGSGIGLLSTAEALLAHVYVGARGEFVNKPAETLEAMQNPDGGWQIRRSLVAARSEISVTESTCSCLRALGEIGRFANNPFVDKGILWLTRNQRPDGGWSSSVEDDESLVFPTTAAIRALVGFGCVEAVSQGVAWLRAAQCADGGWGAYARATDRARASAPAYTAYAIVALVAAGIPGTDPVVVKGCEYLKATFHVDRAEPWESTSFSSLIDSTTAARLEFRHFATPWALAALSLTGHDLSDQIIMDGVQRLMRLQEPNGTWTCGLIAPGTSSVWATHDALFALRTVLLAGSRNLLPIAMERHLAAERLAMQRFVGRLLGGAQEERRTSERRSWVHTAWMSVLTVSVALLFLAQLGVLRQLVSSSGIQQVLAGVTSVVVTVLGATAPSIVTEEYKIRRRRK